jgi:hypothetical protein
MRHAYAQYLIVRCSASSAVMRLAVSITGSVPILQSWARATVGPFLPSWAMTLVDLVVLGFNSCHQQNKVGDRSLVLGHRSSQESCWHDERRRVMIVYWPHYLRKTFNHGTEIRQATSATADL